MFNAGFAGALDAEIGATEVVHAPQRKIARTGNSLIRKLPHGWVGRNALLRRIHFA
jgi:hypothetical protein